MVTRRVRVFAALVVACGVALAACGAGGGDRSPQLGKVPLVAGSHVSVRARRCNLGANAFCALQLVVVGSGYASSRAMLAKEGELLRRRGWSSARATVGLERAADSPGGKLHLIYATASSDLQAVDLGWIRRARSVMVALSRSLFAHIPTLSMVLEFGS